MMLQFMIKHISSLLSHNPQCLYACVDSIVTDVQTSDNGLLGVGVLMENNRLHIRDCLPVWVNAVGEAPACSHSAHYNSQPVVCRCSSVNTSVHVAART